MTISTNALRSTVIAAVVFLLLTASGTTQSPSSARSAVPDQSDFGSTSNPAVPLAVAWKIFALSLGVEVEGAEERTVERLVKQFNASESEAILFVSSSRNYLRTLRTIDADAVRYVRETYPTSTQVPSGAPAHEGTSVGPVTVVRLPRGIQSLKDELTRTGYIAQVQAHHDSAVGSFVSELRRLLPAPVYTALDRWVRNEVAGRITVFDTPTPGSGAGRVAPRPQQERR